MLYVLCYVLSEEMISIKTPEEIKIIAEAGKILAKIMKQLMDMVKPGITTKELNMAAESHIFKYGAEPGFKGPISKGYGGFPTALCTSVNRLQTQGRRYFIFGFRIKMERIFRGYGSDSAGRRY